MREKGTSLAPISKREKREEKQERIEKGRVERSEKGNVERSEKEGKREVKDGKTNAQKCKHGLPIKKK